MCIQAEQSGLDTRSCLALASDSDSACSKSTSQSVQTVLPRKDMPIGTALVFFGQALGGVVFISVARNIFASKLDAYISVVSIIPIFKL
ncbi:hypothetical protein K504DRAFT_466457 [Pleomassaria siparia CBS 279.74]|uniref:Major facilitator superfamily (MFS) profile domain-containing protein n=1 Tax=Pleomassaria siparia CBS 279.74 TaxID=1314801 RepID=A0A6G1KB17_9PLEO|nr:hypothetical protein K504DRAFT_466457 [Pleomassaria siparia CBS 279.74]